MAELFTLDSTKITTGAIDTWYVKSGSASADGWVSLGTLENAEIVGNNLSAPDQYGRNLPYGVAFTAKARIKGTAKAACLQKLNLLNQYFNAHFITLQNAQTLGGTSMGTKWSFVCEGGFDAYRYIDIETDLSFPNVASSGMDYGNFWDPSIGTAAGSTDPLYGFAPGVPITAGWTSLALTSGANASTLTTQLRNTSFRAEFAGTKNQYGSSHQLGVKMTMAFDCLQTDETGIIDVIDAIRATAILTEAELTLPDATVFTIGLMGWSDEYHAGGTFDDPAYYRITLTKSLTPAAFVALIS